MISRDRLVRDLFAAGLAPGQRVVVHSSLRTIGMVAGGADAVIDALELVLGPSGTLVMPTFTFSLPEWGNPPYDPATSPSKVGLVTDTFWRRPDVHRSDHPTHSYAAWGADAEEVTSSQRDAVGPGSPLGWLLHRGGVILQIGTDQTTNTALHLCEELAQVPYLDIGFQKGQSHVTAHRRSPSGDIERVRVDPVPGSSEGFRRIDPLLGAAGIVREARLGQAKMFVTSLAALAGVVVPVLHRHGGLLLGTRTEDTICQWRRARLHQDRAQQRRDLVDLFVEGFPGGQRLSWTEREAIESDAELLAGQAIATLTPPTPEGLVKQLERRGISVEDRPEDGMVFSVWERSERRICLWRGALARLAALLREIEVPCCAPLRGVGLESLRALAMVHEGFHALTGETRSSLQARICEEVAARLFAERLLSLPAPPLLIDVALMHWMETRLPSLPAER